MNRGFDDGERKRLGGNAPVGSDAKEGNALGEFLKGMKEALEK